MSVHVSRRLLAALTLGLGFAAAQADPINLVAYAELDKAEIQGFDTGGVQDGVKRLGNGHALFGERFGGQTLSFNGDFDVLSPTAGQPLTLLSGELGQNLYLSSGLLSGLGKAGVNNGVPVPSALGEGAISVLFDGDQSEVGFQVFGGLDDSNLVVDFFRFDGSLIQSITLKDLQFGGDGFGFRREQDVKDIAGISIWNTDEGGLAIDNLAFNVITTRDPGTPVPAPGALLLAGLALVAAGAMRRR